MGPEYWKPGSPTALKKCSERVSNSCTDETDSCCAVIPCAYCIEWNPEEGDTVYAFADFATNGWSASIAGATWFGSWQRNYETGECEFVVTMNEVEIYRKSCYEGQSCRDSSDSASATIDEVSGVITWTKYEPRPLEYIQDEETHCTTWFCGECECSCECLCVTITDETDTVIASGEICDVSYPCDGPLWDGTIGDYDLSLALGRDQYGECQITATVNGEEQPPVPAAGCSEMTAEIVLEDGTTISVACKRCSCDEEQLACCSCDNTYVGCMSTTLADDCLDDTIAGQVWGTTATVTETHNDWGATTCHWFWEQNFVLSREGCSPVTTIFNLFQITTPSAFAESLGVQACDWVLEIFADGVYQGYVLEFARECIFVDEVVTNTLDWVQFYNVPVPGTSGEVTLTMVRYESPSSLCVPAGRP